jgi:ribonuclease I
VELYGQLMLKQEVGSTQLASMLTHIQQALWHGTPTLAKATFPACQTAVHSFSNKKYQRERAKFHDSLVLHGLWQQVQFGAEIGFNYKQDF